jgi:hypothetical protein
VGDAVGGDAERNKSGLGSDDLVGQAVRQLAPPGRAFGVSVREHIAGLLGDDEGDELCRPTQRAIQPGLVGCEDCLDELFVRDAEL